MALRLTHQSETEFYKRLRAAILISIQERTAELYAFTMNNIALGNINETLLRAEFSMSTGQWTAFKSRMNAAVQARNSLKTLIGE